MSAETFFNSFVSGKQITLPGIDWSMVVATMRESAENCHRCNNKGCQVCHATREIAGAIQAQLTPTTHFLTPGGER